MGVFAKVGKPAYHLCPCPVGCISCELKVLSKETLQCLLRFTLGPPLDLKDVCMHAPRKLEKGFGASKMLLQASSHITIGLFNYPGFMTLWWSKKVNSKVSKNVRVAPNI